MSLFDGGAQRIRGTDVGSVERRRCCDQDPVVGVAVLVDLTVHYSGQWHSALGPTGHPARYAQKRARRHGSGWLGKGWRRRQAFLGGQRLLPLQLPFDDAERLRPVWALG